MRVPLIMTLYFGQMLLPTCGIMARSVRMICLMNCFML